MKPERINQLIAEHIGEYKRLTDEEFSEEVKRCEEINKEPHPHLMLTQPHRGVGTIRDFYNDLNAMHEAEMTLFETEDGWNEYARRLHHAMAQESIKAFIDFQKRDSIIGFAIHAGSAQRAEAFLKTIGKWTE